MAGLDRDFVLDARASLYEALQDLGSLVDIVEFCKALQDSGVESKCSLWKAVHHRQAFYGQA